MTAYDIATNELTKDIGFFPTSTWELTDTDYGKSIATFNWVQAFWDSSYTGMQPHLVFSTGNDSVASVVYFAYSGERIPFKSKVLLQTGTDRRNQTVTSTPIDAGSPTDSLSKVVVYGGQY